MRILLFCTIIAIVSSCSDVATDQNTKDEPVISLQTPEVVDGIVFNPDLPQITISAILDSANSIIDYEVHYDSALVASHLSLIHI